MGEAITEEIQEVRKSSRTIVRELGLLRYVEGRSSDRELNLSNCHALLLLDERGFLTVNELAEQLQLDKSTASRTLAGLIQKGWARSTTSKSDKRSKSISLTTKGKTQVSHLHTRANNQVEEALVHLSPEQRDSVVDGLRLYSYALSRSRAQRAFTIRPIKRTDNGDIAKIIRKAMPEYQCDKPGDALDDVDIADMYAYYAKSDSAYFTLMKGDRIVGGAGFAPLTGFEARKGQKNHSKICELRKMYLLSAARGLGLGRALLEHCLTAAAEYGYAQCYLETTERMPQAIRLYESVGFSPLSAPIGSSGHQGADRWFIKDL